MPGLFDPKNRNPLSMGLLNFGGGLIAAGAPTTDPGQGQRLMGQAFQGFGNAYQGAQQHQMQQELRAMQIEEAKQAAARRQAASQQLNAILGMPASGPSAPAAGGPLPLTAPGASAPGAAPPPGGGSLPLASPPSGPHPLIANMTPAQITSLRALAASDPDAAMKVLQEQAFAKPEKTALKEQAAKNYLARNPGKTLLDFEQQWSAASRAPKAPTGTMAEYAEWKKAHPNGSFLDFKAAVATVTRAPDKPSEWQRNEQALRDAGYSDEQITQMIANKQRFQQGRDQFGRMYTTDMTTGQQIVPEYKIPPRPPAFDRQGSLNPDDMQAGTGASGFFGNIVNKATDLVGAGVVVENVDKAKNILGQLQSRTMLSLADAIPGRPSNLVREELKKFAVNPASLLQGDDSAYNNLKETKNYIDSTLYVLEDNIKNAMQFDPKSVSDLLTKRNEIWQLSQVYDRVITGWGKPDDENFEIVTTPDG